jgi:hypothetical protein
MNVTQNGIAQKMKERQPCHQQDKEEGFVWQSFPAVRCVLPEVANAFYGLGSVH